MSVKVITVARFRQTLSACLADVEEGRSFIVKRRNRVIAKVGLPDNDADADLSRLARSGGVRLAEVQGGTTEAFYRLPKTRAVRCDLGALLREDREDR
jgi:antitoxin (DNA-binding transcriptional repressor) of toxin-antitoxin stability system